MAKRCVGVPFSKVKTSLLVAMSMIVLLILVLQKPNPPTHGVALMVPAGFCGSLLSRMKAISWFNSVKAALCASRRFEPWAKSVGLDDLTHLLSA